jgi:hypothetical protein
MSASLAQATSKNPCVLTCCACLAGRFGIVDEMGVIQGGEVRGTPADTLRRLY